MVPNLSEALFLVCLCKAEPKSRTLGLGLCSEAKLKLSGCFSEQARDPFCARDVASWTCNDCVVRKVFFSIKATKLVYHFQVNVKMLDNNKLKKFNFPLEEIPRYNFDDPRVDKCIAECKPVIIENSNVIRSAMRWDLDYLGKNMPETKCPVLFSSNSKFKYYRDEQDSDHFVPPTKTVHMNISEFNKKLKAWKEGDDRMYLQVSLNKTVGRAIVEDFIKFGWAWVYAKQKVGSWGPLTTNLLFIGMAGNVTPCHYDEQENIFTQIKGHKQCLLFPPEQFECLYPYPVSHPHDRQSQVDFEEPDLKRFPKFKDVKGFQGVVGPGDALYIPSFWWHHVVSVGDDPYTVSINFWFKANPNEPLNYPLKGAQKVTIMRNVEKMLKDVLINPDEVGSLLRTLTLGRYME